MEGTEKAGTALCSTARRAFVQALKEGWLWGADGGRSARAQPEPKPLDRRARGVKRSARRGGVPPSWKSRKFIYR